ncbi:MAG: META domain-containing protein [Burkholderiaceae bacterium]|nr:META domain-containing protein [Burkholderiaceae bacterium]
MKKILYKIFLSIFPTFLLLSACQSGPSVAAGSTGAAASPAAVQGIVDTDWKLVQLEGQPVGMSMMNKPLTLRFTARASNGRVTGFAGCNTFSGSFSQTPDRLIFAPLVMTRMACSEGQALESKYVTVLTGSRAYRWTARSLELLEGDTVLARFERM